MAVEVEVAPLGVVQAAGVGLGQVLGRDQVLVGREAHVADVDPAEQPVPVGVVRLALVEVVEGARPLVALGHRVDRVRRPEHLLVHVVDLAVAHLEVAPERAAQPARLGAMLGLTARWSASAKARLSSGGSAHSPISAYEPVGT